jgi:hypothetical protein
MKSRGRLEKLKRRMARRRASPCPECGIDATLPPEVEFTDTPEERSSEPCRVCGVREVVVVGWGEEEEEIS